MLNGIVLCALIAPAFGVAGIEQLPHGRPTAYKIVYKVNQIAPTKMELGTVIFTAYRDSVLFSALQGDVRTSTLLSSACPLTFQEASGAVSVSLWPEPQTARAFCFPLMPAELAGVQNIRPLAKGTSAPAGCRYESRDLMATGPAAEWQPAKAEIASVGEVPRLESVETFNSDGKMTHRWTYPVYRRFEGCWVPATIRQEWFAAALPSIHGDMTYEWKIESIVKLTGTGNAPEQLVPDGTTVQDYRTPDSPTSFTFSFAAGKFIDQANRARNK